MIGEGGYGGGGGGGWEGFAKGMRGGGGGSQETLQDVLARRYSRSPGTRYQPPQQPGSMITTGPSGRSLDFFSFLQFLSRLSGMMDKPGGIDGGAAPSPTTSPYLPFTPQRDYETEMMRKYDPNRSRNPLLDQLQTARIHPLTNSGYYA